MTLTLTLFLILTLTLDLLTLELPLTLDSQPNSGLNPVSELLALALASPNAVIVSAPDSDSFSGLQTLTLTPTLTHTLKLNPMLTVIP